MCPPAVRRRAKQEVRDLGTPPAVPLCPIPALCPRTLTGVCDGEAGIELRPPAPSGGRLGLGSALGRHGPGAGKPSRQVQGAAAVGFAPTISFFPTPDSAGAPVK